LRAHKMFHPRSSGNAAAAHHREESYSSTLRVFRSWVRHQAERLILRRTRAARALRVAWLLSLIPCSSLLRQFVQIFDERHRRAIEALYFRVGRFDDIVLVRRMSAAAVSEPEMSGRQLERFTGENISWIRASITWPE